jgi:hypothetical protein
MISSSTKRPKHKSFEYQPRYYDPEKERRERRIKFYRSTSARRPNYVWAYAALLLAAWWILKRLG